VFKVAQSHPTLIQGSWKQVRMDLGLAPLKNTVVHYHHPQVNAEPLLRFRRNAFLKRYSRSHPSADVRPLYFADDAQEPQKILYPELIRSLQNIMLQEKAVAEANKKKDQGRGSRGRYQGAAEKKFSTPKLGQNQR
jgi:hypothetical protein